MALDALAIEDTAECPNCGHEVLAKWVSCLDRSAPRGQGLLPSLRHRSEPRTA